MKETALITGITGQDGSYLAKLLLDKGYDVVGILRNDYIGSIKNLSYLNIEHKITYQSCNLCNISEVINVINKYHPQYIYHLASQSSVGVSFNKPIETLNFNINSTINILEAIKIFDRRIKFYHAASSEMFGSSNSLPLNESSILHPVSPYGISKASSYWSTVNYRESYNLFCCSGILFNHESVLRGNNFIIKKIISTALNIKRTKSSTLEVGNIDIKRDFGFAPKYVESMYLMMQQTIPDDYVISSGISLKIKDIIHYIFDKMEISYKHIVINKKFFRPNEIQDIYGNSSKAREKLGWEYDMSFFNVLDKLIEDEISKNPI